MTQGERVKKIRQELNLSQDEFGKIFAIQRQMVSSIEKDKLKLNNEKLAFLCENYNINLNWLLCGKGDMFITAQPSTQDEKDIAEVVKKTMIELILQYGGEDLMKKIFKQL